MQLDLQEVDRAALARLIADERLATVHAYWCARRRARPGAPGAPGAPSALPGRADIEPLDLFRILPQILLADVVGAEQRIRYRVVGTEIVSRWGTDDTGRYLDEMPPSAATDLSVALYRIAVSRRAALYSETNLRPDGNVGSSLLCRLLLPLASDGATVDMVLAAQVQTRPRAAPRAPSGHLLKETTAYLEVEAPARAA